MRILPNHDFVSSAACGEGASAFAAAAPAIGDGRDARRGGEIGKKFVGHVFSDPIDEPRPELRDPAADVSLDIVSQERARSLVGERDFGLTLGEARDPALAFARDRIPDQRDQV